MVKRMISTPPRCDSPALVSGQPRKVPRLRLAWQPDGAIRYPDWAATGQRLGEFGHGIQWWIGDWVRYGNGRWGERYGEAAKITGYEVKSLRNLAYVASRFEPSRRRDNLTWSHHAEVAVLEPADQDSWLDRAIALRLSVADLRELRRTSSLADARVAALGRPRQSRIPAEIVCPNCGSTLPLSLAGSLPKHTVD